MVELSGQKAQSKKLAELLVARITKPYVLYVYRGDRRNNYLAKRRFIRYPIFSDEKF